MSLKIKRSLCTVYSTAQSTTIGRILSQECSKVSLFGSSYIEEVIYIYIYMYIYIYIYIYIQIESPLNYILYVAYHQYSVIFIILCQLS